MKILFIQDNAINESLALTELSSLLKSRGHECALLLEKEERNLFKAAEKFSPDMVIIPSGILAQNFALRIAKEIKKRTYAIVVFAGAHPTFYPEIIRSPFVDVVCRGEAERPILNMADALERNEDITGIKGRWVKKGRRIY